MIIQKNAKGETLYAISWCRRAPSVEGGWRLMPVEYCHAPDDGRARAIFAASHNGRRDKVIAIAPAVGFFVDDNHGEKLTA